MNIAPPSPTPHAPAGSKPRPRVLKDQLILPKVGLLGMLAAAVLMSFSIYVRAEARMGGDIDVSNDDKETPRRAVEPDTPAQRFQFADKTASGTRPQHIVITGGAGYIGSHAVLRLLSLGHFVTVLDNLSRGNYGAVAALREHAPLDVNGISALRFVEGDLGNRVQVREALVDGPSVPDLVIHFAAVAYVGESVAHPLQYYRNITANSLVLLEEMDSAGVTRLVFSSTCATYGEPATLPVTEETPTKPMSPYGSAKLMVEGLIRDYAKSKPSVKVGILRYFNVYGCDPDGRLGEWPRPKLQQQHGRITNACLDAASGAVPKVKILGTNHNTRDGTCVRDFIHVSDLVEAHIAMSENLTNPPALYNVGTGNGVSVRELVTKCRAATGVNFTVEEISEGRPGDSPEIYADNAKIRRELHWAPKYTDVQDGLGHCWNWRKRKLHKGYGSLSGLGGIGRMP